MRSTDPLPPLPHEVLIGEVLKPAARAATRVRAVARYSRGRTDEGAVHGDDGFLGLRGGGGGGVGTRGMRGGKRTDVWVRYEMKAQLLAGRMLTAVISP